MKKQNDKDNTGFTAGIVGGIVKEIIKAIVEDEAIRNDLSDCLAMKSNGRFAIMDTKTGKRVGKNAK